MRQDPIWVTIEAWQIQKGRFGVEVFKVSE